MGSKALRLTAGLQYDCNTQRFSAEAGGYFMGILTEEELTLNEKALYNSCRAKAMYETDYNLIEDIIISHRLLLAANAELSFKNMKLKESLTDISTHVMDIMSKEAYYEAYLQVKGAAYRALEGYYE